MIKYSVRLFEWEALIQSVSIDKRFSITEILLRNHTSGREFVLDFKDFKSAVQSEETAYEYILEAVQYDEDVRTGIDTVMICFNACLSAAAEVRVSFYDLFKSKELAYYGDVQ